MAHHSKNAGQKNGRFIERGASGEKTCSKCRTLRPITAFVVDLSRFGGRGYICEDCRSARRIIPGPTIIERRARALNGERWCSGCKDWLPAAKIHAGRCRACANADARSKYAKDAKFRERRRNHAMVRKRGVEQLPDDAGQLILEAFGGACAYCPTPATGWDHVVPVSKGGKTAPYNMVPACTACNSSKKDADVWEWLDRTGRTAKDAFFDRLSLYHCHAADGPDPF